MYTEERFDNRNETVFHAVILKSRYFFSYLMVFLIIEMLIEGALTLSSPCFLPVSSRGIEKIMTITSCKC